MADTATEPSGEAVADGLAALGAALEFNQHLGITVRAARPGYAEVVLPADAPTGNHVGTIHAVALPAPAELAGAIAAASRIPRLVAAGWVPVAAGFNARFHAPATGDVVATAEVPASFGDGEAAALAARMRVKTAVDIPLHAEGAHVATITVHYVFLPPADHGPAADAG